MKKIIPILLILLLSFHASGARSNTVIFNVSDTHELSAYAESSLTWSEGQQEPIYINFTMTGYQANNSEIFIELVRVIANGTGGGQYDLAIFTVQTSLTATNTSYALSEVVDPPPAFDSFYLDISFVIRASGSGANSDPKTYNFRFPETNTIVVNRDNLVPVINLYGFPPLSYFSFWMPIYGVLLGIMFIPGFARGVQVLLERKNEQKEGSS